MNQDEHNLQSACVQWFNLQHRELRGLLFAVPNGGARSKATAGRLKSEGVVPGVADLILLVPKVVFSDGENGRIIDVTPALCIEMKTDKGRQSTEQKAWQAIVEAQGYKYAVCRSFDDFTRTVNEYLGK